MKKLLNRFPEPYEKQKKFHQETRKYKWFCGGVGSGKTLSGVREAFYLAWVKFPKKKGIVCAPSFSLLRQGFLDKFTNFVPKELYKINQQKFEINFINGSKIFLRSTSNEESLRGIDASWIGFDEPGSEPNGKIFEEFKARLRGDPNSVFWMTGTPVGKYHWTAKIFGSGPGKLILEDKVIDIQGDSNYWYTDKFAVIRAQTWDNPIFPFDSDYVQNLLNNPESTPEFIAQQVKAEFTTYQGVVFPQFINDKSLLKKLSENLFTELFLGFDFGYTDYGALLLMGWNSETKEYGCIKEFYHKSMMVDESGWIGEIKKLKTQYGSKLKWIVADSANPERINAIRNAIPSLNVFKTKKDTLGSIRKTQKLFGDKKLFVDPNCKNLISELNQYQWDLNKNNGKDSIKPGTPDHLVDCLRYAVEQHVTSKTPW
jgi:phage terminase large subunit